MTKVQVNLGENSYEIFIGAKILGEVANFVADSKNFTKKILIVTEENIFAKFGGELTKNFSQAGINFEVAKVPDGETSKNLHEAEKLYTRAINFGLDRKSLILALGGGVIGDLAGFVAATFLRGVNLIQVPTTLLAQVDSSVGGKTAVNHELGKNLIGAFYQPRAVFIDTETLKTLPEREIKSGLGEVVKYGVIADPDFFSYLEENTEKILAGDEKIFTHIIKRSCEIKADTVSRDEKENGLRRILNFGHTIAHVIESETNYQKYRHGEAVSIGMIGAALIGEELGKTKTSDVERLKNLIQKLGMKTFCEGCDPEKMYLPLFRDKKTVGGKINWVLMKNFGEVEVTGEVPEKIVKKTLKNIAV